MAVVVLPLPDLLLKYVAVSPTIFPLFVVYVTNIKPVRDYLRQHDHEPRRGLLRLLWRRITGVQDLTHSNSLGRVACTTSGLKSRSATQHGFGSSANGHFHGTPLVALMEFLPLQQAFGEYCRKALCSEVCAHACVIVHDGETCGDPRDWCHRRQEEEKGRNWVYPGSSGRGDVHQEQTQALRPTVYWVDLSFSCPL